MSGHGDRPWWSRSAKSAGSRWDVKPDDVNQRSNAGEYTNSRRRSTDRGAVLESLSEVGSIPQNWTETNAPPPLARYQSDRIPRRHTSHGSATRSPQRGRSEDESQLTAKRDVTNNSQARRSRFDSRQDFVPTSTEFKAPNAQSISRLDRAPPPVRSDLAGRISIVDSEGRTPSSAVLRNERRLINSRVSATSLVATRRHNDILLPGAEDSDDDNDDNDANYDGVKGLFPSSLPTKQDTSISSSNPRSTQIDKIPRKRRSMLSQSEVPPNSDRKLCENLALRRHESDEHKREGGRSDNVKKEFIALGEQPRLISRPHRIGLESANLARDGLGDYVRDESDLMNDVSAAESSVLTGMTAKLLSDSDSHPALSNELLGPSTSLLESLQATTNSSRIPSAPPPSADSLPTLTKSIESIADVEMFSSPPPPTSVLQVKPSWTYLYPPATNSELPETDLSSGHLFEIQSSNLYTMIQKRCEEWTPFLLRGAKTDLPKVYELLKIYNKGEGSDSDSNANPPPLDDEDVNMSSAFERLSEGDVAPEDVINEDDDLMTHFELAYGQRKLQSSFSIPPADDPNSIYYPSVRSSHASERRWIGSDDNVEDENNDLFFSLNEGTPPKPSGELVKCEKLLQEALRCVHSSEVFKVSIIRLLFSIASSRLESIAQVSQRHRSTLLASSEVLTTVPWKFGINQRLDLSFLDRTQSAWPQGPLPEPAMTPEIMRGHLGLMGEARVGPTVRTWEVQFDDDLVNLNGVLPVFNYHPQDVVFSLIQKNLIDKVLSYDRSSQSQQLRSSLRSSHRQWLEASNKDLDDDDALFRFGCLPVRGSIAATSAAGTDTSLPKVMPLWPWRMPGQMYVTNDQKIDRTLIESQWYSLGLKKPFYRAHTNCRALLLAPPDATSNTTRVIPRDGQRVNISKYELDHLLTPEVVRSYRPRTLTKASASPLTVSPSLEIYDAGAKGFTRSADCFVGPGLGWQKSALLETGVEKLVDRFTGHVESENRTCKPFTFIIEGSLRCRNVEDSNSCVWRESELLFFAEYVNNNGYDAQNLSILMNNNCPDTTIGVESIPKTVRQCNLLFNLISSWINRSSSLKGVFSDAFARMFVEPLFEWADESFIPGFEKRRRCSLSEIEEFKKQFALKHARDWQNELHRYHLGGEDVIQETGEGSAASIPSLANDISYASLPGEYRIQGESTIMLPSTISSLVVHSGCEFHHYDRNLSEETSQNVHEKLQRLRYQISRPAIQDEAIKAKLAIHALRKPEFLSSLNKLRETKGSVTDAQILNLFTTEQFRVPDDMVPAGHAHTPSVSLKGSRSSSRTKKEVSRVISAKTKGVPSKGNYALSNKGRATSMSSSRSLKSESALSDSSGSSNDDLDAKHGQQDGQTSSQPQSSAEMLPASRSRLKAVGTNNESPPPND